MVKQKRILSTLFLFGWHLSTASLSTHSPSDGSVVPPASAPTATAPASLKISHGEIQVLARQGLLDSAFSLSQKVLAEDSTEPFALFMNAKLNPKGKLSADYFRKVIKASAAGAEAEESYFRQGQYYYAAGKYYLAIPLFRDYLRRYPQGDWQDPALYWIGNACLTFALSNPEKSAYLDSALIYFQNLGGSQRAGSYYPPLGMAGIAKTKAALGDPLGAAEAAKSALEKAPEEERPPLLLLSAQLQHAVSREGEKRFIDTLISLFPQSPEARYLRKINSGLAQANWKSGTGIIKTAAMASKDSLSEKGSPSAKTNALNTPVANFTLQIGAFSQASNAKSLLLMMTRLDLSPEIVETKRNGKALFQVRLGRFPSADSAAEYAKKYLKPHQLLSQPVPLSP